MLKNRFRCLHKGLYMDSKNAIRAIYVCSILHNYCVENATWRRNLILFRTTILTVVTTPEMIIEIPIDMNAGKARRDEVCQEFFVSL